MIVNALLFLGALAAMELVAYLMHKYLMHGPLWFLHESHHVPHKGSFELNDLFGIFFALPSIALIYFGFHDVVVHRRVPIKVNPKKGYLRRIIQAHHMHHATRVRDGAVSFGFLYAPPLDELRSEREKLKAD
jgi:beta-carotene 3-hydroxylase